MTTDNFSFYLQNRVIQTGQTGGQLYSDTSPLVFPGLVHAMLSLSLSFTHTLYVFCDLYESAIITAVPYSRKVYDLLCSQVYNFVCQDFGFRLDQLKDALIFADAETEIYPAHVRL